MWHIGTDDLTSAQTRALVAEHLADMHGHSPACSVHALDLSSLDRPEVQLFTAWDADRIGGMAALLRLDRDNAELKSMRTTATARGTGLGRALLHHVVDVARRRGTVTLWLETGAHETFAAARGLYLSEGFTPCPPFGDYAPDPLSVFMTRKL